MKVITDVPILISKILSFSLLGCRGEPPPHSSYIKEDLFDDIVADFKVRVLTFVFNRFIQTGDIPCF